MVRSWLLVDKRLLSTIVWGQCSTAACWSCAQLSWLNHLPLPPAPTAFTTSSVHHQTPSLPTAAPATTAAPARPHPQRTSMSCTAPLYLCLFLLGMVKANPDSRTWPRRPRRPALPPRPRVPPLHVWWLCRRVGRLPRHRPSPLAAGRSCQPPTGTGCGGGGTRAWGGWVGGRGGEGEGGGEGAEHSVRGGGTNNRAPDIHGA